MISFVVYGTPAPAGSKTVGFAKSGRHFVRDSSGHCGTDWRRNVAQAAGITMRAQPLLTGALHLDVRFHVPRPKGHYGARGLRPSAPLWPTVKPDATKLTRAVEDALTGICVRDDAQFVSQRIVKSYGEPARCEVRIYDMDEAEIHLPEPELQLELRKDIPA